MNIKIASWNVEGRLSKTTSLSRGTPDHIIKTIRLINADIMILPDAHNEEFIEKLKSKQSLIDMGYSIFNAPYDDDAAARPDTNSDYMSLVLLTRLPVSEFKIIKLGNFRNAIDATFTIEEGRQFRIFGVHLDDRSEDMRVKQINDLINITNKTTIPVVVMGDFNAMHGEDFWPARILCSKFIKILAKHVWPSVFGRAVEMARGEALKSLETKTDLIDIDQLHRPTTTPKMRGHEWMPNIRLIQIDHIFTSKSINCNNYNIATDGGSDHRAISVEIII